ncbi:MAG TPA: galactose oxidase-like domain-containing protein, partial [Acidimicrobiales bacterium]
ALDLYPRAILAPNGKVFLVKDGAGKSSYMDVDTQTWTTVGKPPPVPGGGGMAMYDAGKLLLFATGTSATDSWTIDLNAAAPAWHRVGSLSHGRKKFSTVLLPDGGVMAVGGSSDGTSDPAKAVLTPEIWDPATGTWATLPDLAVPRMYHSNALLLPDGRVLSAGGGRSPGAQDFPNAQLYSPEYLSLPSRPSITSLSSTVWTAGGTASLNVSSANGLGSVVLMGLPAVTHGLDTSARRLVLSITSAYNPGTGAVGVQVPSVANAPAGHYYAIALDGRGVPSEARIVQVVPAGGGAATPAAAPAATAELAVPRVVVVPGAAEKD